jgi:hypothetical protein
MTVLDQIRGAFAAVVEDLGVPADLVTETVEPSWTVVAMDLPDGTDVRVAGVGREIRIRITDCCGHELSRMDLTNIAGDLLAGVLSAVVTESLKD